MYWPSCSRDGEYVFRYHDGPSLNPDTVLQEYEDWRDISQWPTCPDEVRIEKRHADKQQDPTKKENLVGVFCRTYTVPEAISKFLPDVYTPTEKGDRYTYTAGSTYGGLVIYDNGLFCFSNHATDPAHGMDLNAFDLVRTHLFGKDDENEEIPVTKRPSWAEMTKLVDTDGECKKTIAADRKQRIEQIFAGEFGVSDGDDSWRERLEIKKGVVVASVINLQLILLHDENLQSVRYNSLRQTIVAGAGLFGFGGKRHSGCAHSGSYEETVPPHLGVFQSAPPVGRTEESGEHFHPVSRCGRRGLCPRRDTEMASGCGHTAVSAGRQV